MFFLIVGAIGFVLVLFSMFSGHDGEISVDHDVGHDGGGDSISIFSFRTITTFMTAFGGIGALCTYFEKTILVASIWGIVAGLLFAFIAWWLTSFATKQQASSVIDSSDLIGKTGVVHTSVPEGGTGEVQIEYAGQRKYMPAKSQEDQPISSGTIVFIKDHVSGVLIVSKSNS